MLCIVRQGFAEIPHSRKASLSHSHFRQLKFIIRNGKNRLHAAMHFQSEVVQILLIEGLEQREAVLFFMNFSQGATFLQTKEKLLIGSLQQREVGSFLSEIINLSWRKCKRGRACVAKVRNSGEALTNVAIHALLRELFLLASAVPAQFRIRSILLSAVAE